MLQRRIGIIGGVGPSAGWDLCMWITLLTHASKDQEHLRVIVDSHPQIPDRTKAILYGGESPVPYVVESARLLEEAGAQVIGIPCNTMHFFLAQIQAKISIPIINMIKETGGEIKKLGFKKIGLLSTSGTAKSRVYQQFLERMGINIIIPGDGGIEKEMEAIYGDGGIKAGIKYERSKKNKKLLKEVILELQKQGAQAIIMGCTEIPLCLEEADSELPLINPTKVLAQALVDIGLGKRKI